MKRSLLLLYSFLLSSGVYAQSKLGVEFSYLATSTTISVPKLMSDQVAKADSGPGHFLSFGVTRKVTEDVTLRGGLNFWTLAFSPTVNGTYNNQPATGTETGSLSFSGIYLRVDRTWHAFFLTGGFDISFSKSNKNDLIIRNASGQVLYQETGRSESLVTSSFNNQFNLVLGLGPSISVGKSFKLKGILSAVVPFSSIYDSGVKAKQVYVSTGAPAPDANVNLHYYPFITYGVGLAYSFDKGN